MKQLRVALGFLTVIPVDRAASSLPVTARCAPWFPVVGLGIGILATAILTALSSVAGTGVASWATVACWAIITGGLHLDGVADSADALLVSAPRERRLEILKDSRVGAFGVIGLVLVLLGKVEALRALAGLTPGWFVHPLLLAPLLGRWLVVLLAAPHLPREGGLGQAFSRDWTPRLALGATLLPVVGIAVAGIPALVGAAAVLAVGVLIARLAILRLGGVSGDVLGLQIEVAELVFLLVSVMLLTPEAP